jgi:hypothetical protein
MSFSPVTRHASSLLSISVSATLFFLHIDIIAATERNTY